MSNQENPCAGYLIEASKLAAFIPVENRPAFDDALENHDFDQASSCWTKPFPMVSPFRRRFLFWAIAIPAMGTWSRTLPMPTSTRTTSTRNGRSHT